MIHTGNEENKRKFLISANDIKNDFSVCTTGDNKGKYYIPGTILNSSKYEVTNNKASLDRIEHAIKLADFASNRRFLSQTIPSFFTSSEEIDYPYILPLENNWVNDIPKEFIKLKKELTSFILDIEEVYEKIKVTLEKTNPLETLEIINGLLKDHGLFNHSFDTDLEELELAAKEHGEKYNSLKELGVIDRYLEIQKRLERDIVEFLEPKIEEISRNQAYVITLEYNKEDLSDYKTFSEVKERSEIPISKGPLCTMIGIIHSEPGKIVIYYFPKMFGGYRGENWNEKLNNALYILLSPLMTEIYLHLFPDKRE